MANEFSTKLGGIRADHNGKFYQRFLLIGIGLLAGAGWFFYDGTYAWPAINERYAVYEELVEAQRGDEWEDRAAEEGWPLEPPEKHYSDAQIQNQFYFGWGLVIAGVGFLAKVLLARGRWMESDGTQITTSWGQTVPYDGVTQIDKRKWANKGIAYIHYTDGGQTKKFVLDDFKFLRTPTDAMLYELEQAVGVDKITGGEPEPDPNAAPVEPEPSEAEPVS